MDTWTIEATAPGMHTETGYTSGRCMHVDDVLKTQPR